MIQKTSLSLAMYAFFVPTRAFNELSMNFQSVFVFRIRATMRLHSVSKNSLPFQNSFIPVESQHFSKNQDQNHADEYS